MVISALLAAAQAATPVSTALAPAPAVEKKVCWRDQATGSIMPPKRICMTLAERRAWVARMQGNVSAFRDRPQRAPRE